jgi:transcriptional regulator with XRE-family HTH domain
MPEADTSQEEGMAKGKREPSGNDLGLALTILRTIRGLTQGELASHAGIRSPAISNYESGKVRPGLRRLEEILGAMGFPLSMIQEAERFIAFARQDSSDTSELVPDFKRVADEIGRASTHFAESIFLLLQRAHCKEETSSLDPADSPERDRASALLLWKELSNRTSREQAEIIADPRSHTWAFSELLCKESIAAASRNPRQAVALADAAVSIARSLSELPFKSRLLGYALAHSANALRAAGDLAAAGHVMHESEAHWSPEGVDPLTDAVTYTLRASLRRTQGAFEEAIALHNLALQSSGAESLRVEILVSKAYTLDEAGDLEAMVEVLREASSALTPETDPRLHWSIRHNLLDALSKAGHYADAQALLPEVRRLIVRGGSRELDFARLQWIEGRIAAGLGRLEEAVPLLLRARGVFMSQGIALDAALLTLEISEIYLAEGRSETVRDLARNLATLFQAQALPRETLAALNLFRRAAETATVNSDFVERLLGYLRKSRYNPKLRFEA